MMSKILLLALAGASLPSLPAAAQSGPRTKPSVVAAAAKDTPAIPPGPYAPTWVSVSRHGIPPWYQDAKFGISMHWGLYSVPAHGSEWYAKNMVGDAATYQWHLAHFGPLARFGYKDFIPMFTAAKWDPDAWAVLFKKAGARYVMPSAEHHDGFALWDSAVNPYNAKAMGPKRDLIGDLAVAVRKAGLKFGVTNHSMEHFSFINPTAVPPAVLAELKAGHQDLYDPAWSSFYSVADRSDAACRKFLAAWVEQNEELIDKYHLDLLWWDNGANPAIFDPLKLQVFAYFYNRAQAWGAEVSMITKGTASKGGHVEDYERQSRMPKTIQPAEFEVHDSPMHRWCYLTEDTYQGVDWGLNRLIEAVCRNGNFLLNIGPRADGTIPDQEVALLLGMGRWLDVNGDAIYGTRAWKIFGEGNFRYTTKGGGLYAIMILPRAADAGPAGGEALLPALATGTASPGAVEKVELLGHPGALEFSQDETGLKVKLPAAMPSEYAVALKITGLKLPAAR
jgi:alpha-L-fucosidase